jgi:release factor glutamine methyltransferase
VVETLGSLLVEAAGALSAAGYDQPRRHARRLVASALAISQAELFGHPDRALDERHTSHIRVMLGRMLQREPLSRILGRREFWGLELSLSAETLDPRPETETLVAAVLRQKPDQRAPLRFLDLGTGTGCLLLALLGEFTVASGVGIDIAEGAARTAMCNAARLGFADRALFFVSNWGTAVSGRFDAIIANPPYIAHGDLTQLPPEVACFDPRLALDGGDDGLRAYHAIAPDLPRLLASEGIFATEVGVDQAEPVAAILEANGLAFVGTEPDLSGISRCVLARRGQISSRRQTVRRSQKNVGMRRGPV